jgi:hypothetical protein
MDSTPRPNPPSRIPQEDVDLGQLFYKTGGAINSFFTGLKTFLTFIGNCLLNFLFFIRRKLIWLLAGALIGMGYGYFIVSKYGIVYTADLTVQANFNSTRSLYGAIDYFNSLMGSHTDELAKVLNITHNEAASLRSLEAEPVKSEIINSQIYQNQYINSQYGLRPRMDTFWNRVIGYKEFKSSLTKYDYPQQLITVTSTDAAIFPKLQQGIIDRISSNELLQQARNKSAVTNKGTIDMLSSSIKSLDTLTSAYSKHLMNSGSGGDSRGNSLTLTDGNATSRFPELEVYDKILSVNEELKNAQNRYVIENNIIQVYSPFPSIGQRENFFRQSVVRYGLTGLTFVFLLLAALSLYKLLTRLEKERKLSSNNPK